VSGRALVVGSAALALFGLALGVRLAQQHEALLYPDGYQYLLMARGIAEHLQPTTELGPGGDQFVPSADASVKPLFPLLVAVVHAVGLPWLDAAHLVTALAGAVAVAALVLLVVKLTGSRLAGAAAGALLLASPSVGFWSGFAGPDPVAQALVLTAALALAHRRATTGGVLVGLAVAARPEVALLAGAAAIVSLRSHEGRAVTARAAPAAMLALSVVFLVLRTPLAVPDSELVRLAPLGLVATTVLAFTPARLLPWASVAGGLAIALAIATQEGPALLWEREWPLLVLSAAGLAVLVVRSGQSGLASAVVGAVLLLGSVYIFKNPGLERYFGLLLPAAALVAGLAVGALSTRVRPLALGAVGVVVALGVLSPVPGARDHDMFAVVAERVGPRVESAALLTAAPDAYGFWLPDHTVRSMSPGARGAVLLDATQRLYEPNLAADGAVVVRVGDEIAFSRPDGEIDADPAVLVSGRVVLRHGGSAP
jgi:hypothetical protein